MPRPNDGVAALLAEYAELISITGGDAFRSRSYERAARAIRGHPVDVSDLDAAELRQIPGVGKSVADKVTEYLRTGSIAAVEAIRAEIPPGVREMIAIPALGPNRALQLHAELGIGSVAELTEAVKDGRLRDLKGFGPKSEERILRGIELLAQAGERVLLSTGLETAEDMVAALRAVPGCVRCTYAGSARRMRETVGDIDILAAVPSTTVPSTAVPSTAVPTDTAATQDPAGLVSAAASAPLMAAFVALPSVAEVIASGPTKTTVRTNRGLQVDLRVVPEHSWGAALQYFTGSQAHNVRTREIAVRRGYKLSEYGLFEVETGGLIASLTEEDIYRALGMNWIPPTLREDGGEIEAASRDELPDLVTEADLRGDLHTHTNLTDGMSSLEDMVSAAQDCGYEYYAITDHAPDLIMHRMTDEKMLAQREQVRALQAKLQTKLQAALLGTPPALTLLHGSELNIGPDGSVDWPASFLDGFDICVASVHSHFGQPRAEMTRRFIRAAENPHVNVIGHPLTRIIGRRDPVDVDLDELFRACARTGTALEINGSPHRRDLPDEHLRRAKEAGVKFAIDSDAHATSELSRPRYGVGSAQRGWLTKDDVINTWPLDRLRTFLRKAR
ncbi:MAG TPA: helix-hairpin-helix domain-containing protein [Streptosporangiaceae bacterium]|jgi:DNA polymerase (family 10)|nr:helix-hairpin-helix domain-containing protein [Streptosporangiaceae bacterium]